MKITKIHTLKYSLIFGIISLLFAGLLGFLFEKYLNIDDFYITIFVLFIFLSFPILIILLDKENSLKARIINGIISLIVLFLMLGITLWIAWNMALEQYLQSL